MQKLLILLPVLFVVACSTTGSKPDTGPYAAMDCTQLEAERVRLVAELDALSAGDDVAIDKTRAAMDSVGAAQVAKGCAG